MPNGNPNDCTCPTNINNNIVGSTIIDEELIRRIEEAHQNDPKIIQCCSTNEKTDIKPMQQTHAFEQKELDRTQQLLETALISIIQKYQAPKQEQQPIIPTPLPVTLPLPITINPPNVLQDMMCAAGEKKAKESLDQVIILSLLSGVFVGFGGIASMKTGGSMAGWDATNPGFGRLIFSGVFTVGLMLVIVAGSELFTSNSMVMFVAMLRRKVNAWQLCKNLVISLTFNVLGAFIICYFLMYLPTTEKEMHTAPFVTYAKSLGEKKVSRSHGLTILLGIGCNWLVCLAVYMTYASHILVDKLIALFMPILAFVAGGFEHSVANGFFIPLAMLYGSPITMYDFLVTNLMPATLGNLLGGAFFVGMCFWYTHGVRLENIYYFDTKFTLKARETIARPILNLWDRVAALNPFLKQENQAQSAIELADQKV
ncbi:predicted protein [Naegleria gruberi]|uniref:Predicted protein n=1 Tax=Naegleria gruberi TaxID=5762 RepID=D2VL06_NAEGR|nr:uncharacterized protein NAEGRDRAFT_50436 [Naegleria gruberi]EFC42454.1 predicted protein [Naegleria gruberi]|eukprot:XP_002675198.1 predicted protein [Naegleria gruberi strain NEG-M]